MKKKTETIYAHVSTGRQKMDMQYDELDALGIDFISQENHLETSTPSGKLVFQVIAAVAEFERDIIVERVKQLPKEGKSWREIGRVLGIVPSGVRKKFRKNVCSCALT